MFSPLLRLWFNKVCKANMKVANYRNKKATTELAIESTTLLYWLGEC